MKKLIEKLYYLLNTTTFYDVKTHGVNYRWNKWK